MKPPDPGPQDRSPVHRRRRPALVPLLRTALRTVARVVELVHVNDCSETSTRATLARLTALCAGWVQCGVVVAQPCGMAIVNPPTRERLNGTIHDLELFDDGTGNGARLYACGTFTDASPARGLALGGIARIGANGFEAVAGANVRTAYSMEPLDDGSGPALWVATSAVNGARRWSAASGWTTHSGATVFRVLRALDFGDGNGPLLFGGALSLSRVYRWDPVAGSWVVLPQLAGFGGSVGIMGIQALDPDGEGPQPKRLVASSSGGLQFFDGSQWQVIWSTWTHALELADDGVNGVRLYTGTHPGGSLPLNTALSGWNGTDWHHAIGGSQSWNPGYAIASIDMGPGIGPRIFSLSTAGVIMSNPTGLWQRVNGTPISYGSFPIYKGPLLAFRTAGGVPVVVTIDSIAQNGLLRIAGCPRCPADRNLDGAADVGDLFDFLGEWFGSASPNLQQLFDFLALWFGGC